MLSMSWDSSPDYPDYQGVLIFQVSLCSKGYYGTLTKCLDYCVLINRFHCSLFVRKFVLA